MRVVSISIIVMLLIVFGTVYKENSEVQPQELLSNMDELHNKTFEIATQSFNYTNLYETKPTVQNVMYNFIHGIAYAIIVEMNTLIPVVAYGAKDLPFLLKIAILFFVIMFIGLIFKGVYFVIALVFFIREKRRMKEKVYT